MAWRRWARTVHWWSGAACLAGMLLFAVTGITLNHAHQIGADPRITEQTGQLPAALRVALDAGWPASGEGPLPPAIADHLTGRYGVTVAGRPVEWSGTDLYVGLPRPGGDGWISIDRQTGDIFYERTDRGPIAYLNDLHKGRNAGPVWFWFIDLFAAVSVIFCVTGLLLIQLQARRQKLSWPITAFGAVVPVVIALIFIH